MVRRGHLGGEGAWIEGTKDREAGESETREVTGLRAPSGRGGWGERPGSSQLKWQRGTLGQAWAGGSQGPGASGVVGVAEQRRGL